MEQIKMSSRNATQGCTLHFFFWPGCLRKGNAEVYFPDVTRETREVDSKVDLYGY